MSAFPTHGFISHLLNVVVLGLALASSADALELWSDPPPRVPDAAIGTLVTRSVTHRDGVEVPARTRPYLQLEQRSDGVVGKRLYDDRGRYLWTTIFETVDDRLTSITAISEDRVRWEMRFEYDARGRPVRESYFAANDRPERTITYEYAGDSTEVVAYRNDGTVSWRRSETAGLSGDQRETTFFYPDGSRVKTIVASVDESGRVVSEEHLDELGAVYRTVEREYRDDAMIEETVRGETGALIRRTTWEYDLYGYLVSRSTELPAERVVESLEVDYTRNARGDWIRQVRTTTAQFDDREPVVTDREVLQREIEYE
jgi:YD repeat-containing protein